jgi:hypothetical protein
MTWASEFGRDNFTMPDITITLPQMNCQTQFLIKNIVSYMGVRMELRYTAHFTHYIPPQMWRFIMLKTAPNSITTYQDIKQEFHQLFLYYIFLTDPLKVARCQEEEDHIK